ncbi:MAG: hypothetical protein SGARI_003873, partial [Bacillariaceae sp.]
MKSKRRKRPELESPQFESSSSRQTKHQQNTEQPVDDDDVDDDHYLQRLRLDVDPNATAEAVPMRAVPEHKEFDIEDKDEDDDATTRTDSTDNSASSTASIRSNPPGGATEADFSKFLLRVDDVNVMAPPNPASDKVLRTVYVDLDTESGDERITKSALSQLIQRGIDVSASNPAVEFSCSTIHGPAELSASAIDWKPEGKTKRDVKALSQMSEEASFAALRSKVLIWSGKYRGVKYHGSDNAIFMARGVVNG